LPTVQCQVMFKRSSFRLQLFFLPILALPSSIRFPCRIPDFDLGSSLPPLNALPFPFLPSKPFFSGPVFHPPSRPPSFRLHTGLSASKFDDGVRSVVPFSRGDISCQYHGDPSDDVSFLWIVLTSIRMHWIWNSGVPRGRSLSKFERCLHPLLFRFFHSFFSHLSCSSHSYRT